ncbi:visual pigment-like receptor peropsin [Sorex fumeus]|uniref:visual pigment-like receptor peropsin n=1 Tax=Sorex fumeus TaxID=62283 RepID=UPI0024AE4DCB|nr:visual pigment-like receptor peropsin [Sorex fumeus]
MLENHSDNTSGPTPEDSSAFSQTEHRLVAAYLIVAGVISILSNIVVLGIFIKYKELQTRTNAIIINLAFTDIGVSSIGYPMSAASDLHGSWRFGYAGCQVYAGLNIFFGMASIGLLTLVAVDRYLTLCHPDTGRSMTTNSYVGLILGAWINGFFWALMPILGWASYAPDPTGATCTINWRKNDISFVSYTMTVVAVNFIMPLTVMAYCYYHVIRSMHNGPGHLDGDWSSQVDVTKMSVIMILAFLAAWTPYSIVCFWASFGDPKKIPPSMAIIAPLFAKSSTFYNPCIYAVANKKFRRAMFAMLTCQTPQVMPATSILPMDGAQSPQLLEQTEMRAEVYLNVAIC